jgi:hypothetical protein
MQRQLRLLERGGVGVDGTSAEYSPCKLWRYSLTRLWRPADGHDEHAGSVAFVALNPSTATEYEDDPTVRRMIRFAKEWGHGGLVVLNAFAYRSTDPRGLYNVADPVGVENDFAILRWVARVSRLVVAWGRHGTLHGRSHYLSRLLADANPMCLGTNGDGSPKHPLYVAADTPLRRWTGRPMTRADGCREP